MRLKPLTAGSLRIFGTALMIATYAAIGLRFGYESGLVPVKTTTRLPLRHYAILFVTTFLISIAIGFWARRKEPRSDADR
jgi:hypothetical protein